MPIAQTVMLKIELGSISLCLVRFPYPWASHIKITPAEDSPKAASPIEKAFCPIGKIIREKKDKVSAQGKPIRTCLDRLSQRGAPNWKTLQNPLSFPPKEDYPATR